MSELAPACFSLLDITEVVKDILFSFYRNLNTSAFILKWGEIVTRSTMLCTVKATPIYINVFRFFWTVSYAGGS